MRRIVSAFPAANNRVYGGGSSGLTEGGWGHGVPDLSMKTALSILCLSHKSLIDAGVYRDAIQE
jgi:hypothetical protein